jgi:hypothetical protein
MYEEGLQKLRHAHQQRAMCLGDGKEVFNQQYSRLS